MASDDDSAYGGHGSERHWGARRPSRQSSYHTGDEYASMDGSFSAAVPGPGSPTYGHFPPPSSSRAYEPSDYAEELSRRIALHRPPSYASSGAEAASGTASPPGRGLYRTATHNSLTGYSDYVENQRRPSAAFPPPQRTASYPHQGYADPHQQQQYGWDPMRGSSTSAPAYNANAFRDLREQRRQSMTPSERFA
ncbi:hypothetical protein JCM10908_004497 [Rhodotorula pacifica]|uniref:uncharacterized protein n=1 Tax=Rhodotorula pacifica TaxID=1495444 RepID=UPI0031772E9E